MAYIDNSVTRRSEMRYIRTAMREPLLEKEQELKLARLWKEKKDEKSLHALVRAYARLVVSMASSFKNYGLPMADLIQEGNVGLMEAAARFEPDLENRFSTYAMWWVKAQMQDYVLKNWSIVRSGTSAGQKALFFNLRRLRARIQGQSSRDYLDDIHAEKIARELDVNVEDVRDMEARFNGGDLSLNTPVGDDAGPQQIQDFMADPSPSPEDIVIGMKDNQARSKWLNEALATLSTREQTIVKRRQMSSQTVTLEALGKDLGISKERVRQLEERALEKLKVSLAAGLEKETLMDMRGF